MSMGLSRLKNNLSFIFLPFYLFFNTVRRLIATMQSKQAYLKHTNAYTAFVTYAKMDKSLEKNNPPNTQSGRKYYTRDEAMAYIRFKRMAGSLEDNFTLEPVNGQYLWSLKQ